MRQEEVIQELLRNAPSSPPEAIDGLGDGEKLIRAHDLGPVDADAISAWVTGHGGRAVDAPGDPRDVYWAVAEAELGL